MNVQTDRCLSCHSLMNLHFDEKGTLLPCHKVLLAEVERLTADRDRLQRIADENYADLLDQMQERWGDAQEIGRPEINAFMESRFVHRPMRSLRTTLAAERAARPGQLRAAFVRGWKDHTLAAELHGDDPAEKAVRRYPDPPEVKP